MSCGHIVVMNLEVVDVVGSDVRSELLEEERLVSYWRRCVHSRLDTVYEGSVADMVEGFLMLIKESPVHALHLQESEDVNITPIGLGNIWAKLESGVIAHEYEFTDELVRCEKLLSNYRQQLHIKISSIHTV